MIRPAPACRAPPRRTRNRMALAVTIFGMAERSSAGILIYAYLRDVRGSGDYPPPVGSRDKPSDEVGRRTLEGTELEVIIWDRTFTDAESAKVLSDLKAGRFTIP